MDGLRGVSRRFGLTEAERAEVAIRDELRTGRLLPGRDLGLRTDVYVFITLDAAVSQVAEAGQELVGMGVDKQKAVRMQRQDTYHHDLVVQRARHLEVLFREGEMGQIAYLMAANPDKQWEIRKQLLDERRERQGDFFQAFTRLIDNGVLERHEIDETLRPVLDHLRDTAHGVLGGVGDQVLGLVGPERSALPGPPGPRAADRARRLGRRGPAGHRTPPRAGRRGRARRGLGPRPAGGPRADPRRVRPGTAAGAGTGADTGPRRWTPRAPPTAGTARTARTVRTARTARTAGTVRTARTARTAGTVRTAVTVPAAVTARTARTAPTGTASRTGRTSRTGRSATTARDPGRGLLGAGRAPSRDPRYPDDGLSGDDGGPYGGGRYGDGGPYGDGGRARDAAAPRGPRAPAPISTTGTTNERHILHGFVPAPDAGVLPGTGTGTDTGTDPDAGPEAGGDRRPAAAPPLAAAAVPAATPTPAGPSSPSGSAPPLRVTGPGPYPGPGAAGGPGTGRPCASRPRPRAGGRGRKRGAAHGRAHAGRRPGGHRPGLDTKAAILLSGALAFLAVVFTREPAPLSGGGARAVLVALGGAS